MSTYWGSSYWRRTFWNINLIIMTNIYKKIYEILSDDMDGVLRFIIPLLIIIEIILNIDYSNLVLSCVLYFAAINATKLFKRYLDERKEYSQEISKNLYGLNSIRKLIKDKRRRINKSLQDKQGDTKSN